jgi:alanine dehydrogenase
LVSHGHTIIIEAGAGVGSFFTDLQYSEVGAQIVQDAATAFQQNMVLKVNPPTSEEIEYLKPNTYLVSALQINLRDKEYFCMLADKKVNAIAF